MISIYYKKNRIIQAFSPLLMLVILSVSIGIQRSHAQTCYTLQGCSDYANFGINATTAATLEYDNYVCAFHSTAVRDIDGSFKVWGEMAMADGVSSALLPQTVNPGNYPGLTGTPLKIAMGSGSINNVQFVMLTSDNKLWVWGKPGTVFATSVVSTSAFQQLPIGLPSGVTAANVKMLFATNESLVLTTCSGDVYAIVQYWGNVGDGTSNVNVWHQVQKSATAGGGNLNGIIATRGSRFGFIALDNAGRLWTWGYATWDGSTAAATRSRAVQITAPTGATGSIKMIGMTKGAGSNTSVYVLYTNGSLYALGYNGEKQLGDWTTTTSNTWVQPRYTSASGPVMNDIKWISPQEHDAIFGHINVLTNSETIYNWGEESGYDLGRGVRASNSGGTPVDPGEPTQFEGGYTNSNIVAIESGGHTTMALRRCAGDFGYVGHRVNGSMGDNSSVNNTDNIFHFTTNAVQVCGALTTIAELNASVEGPYYVGNSVTLMGSPTGGTYTLASGPATLAGTTLTFTGAGTVRISYSVTDAACASTVTISKIFNVTTATAKVTIPGNIWIDTDADALIDAGESGFDNGLWANLVKPDGTVIASVKVNSNGTYQFDMATTDIATSGNYAVILTNNSKNPGDPLSTADVPANNYSYTGVNRGGASANTANITGVFNIGNISGSAAGATLIAVNFGIRSSVATIAGTVWNDANGDRIVDGTEPGTEAGASTLTAYLVNSSGNVVSSSDVAANGSYSLSGATIGTAYTVVLSNTAGIAAGSPAPAASLPSGWVNTGELFGTGNSAGAGSETATPGVIAVTPTGNVTGLNFGIEQPPTANAVTGTSQQNPGGNGKVVVPTLNGSDPEQGTFNGSVVSGVGQDTIKIVSLPTNGTLYYNGAPVTAGQIILNYNPALLTVDPNDGISSLSFTYSELDAAMKESAPATVTMPFTTAVPFGCDNRAYFLNGPNTNVQLSTYNLVTGVSTTPIASFNTLANGLAYNPLDNMLYLLVTPSPIASNLPQLARVDGNGVITTLNVPNLNAAFPAVPNPTAAGITSNGYYVAKLVASLSDARYLVIDVNPSRATYLQIVDPGNSYAVATAPFYKTASAALTISDMVFNPADGLFYGITNTAALATLNIVTGTFATGNTIMVNGAPYSGGSVFGSTYIDATGSLYAITNSGISLKINISNGISGTGAGVAAQLADGPNVTNTDGANCPSALFSYSISGNVYHDTNGLIDNIVNGTGTNAGGTLYAVLYDNTTGAVLASVPVAADGSYMVGGTPGNNYTVYLTTTAPVIGQSAPPTVTLPADWVNTGENVGATAGSDAAANGTNGILVVGTLAAPVTNANFGIEQPPVAGNDSSSGNTTGTAVTINPLTNDTDADGTLNPGTVSLVNPGGATGVVTDANGDITSMSIPGEGTWSVNTSTGAITFTPQAGFAGDPTPINYNVEDNAGQQSNNATVTITYQPVYTISGTVWNDANGDIVAGVTEPGTNAGSSGLTAYLVDGSGNVVSSSAVSASGTYSLSGAVSGTAYTVVLSNTPGITAGNPAPAPSLPSGWVNTGEQFGTNNSAGTGSETGIIGVIAVTPSGNVTGLNFGAERTPDTQDKSQVVTYPTGGTIPAGAVFTDGTGTDPEDGALSGNTGSLAITQLPANATMYYNGNPVTLNMIISSFNPALLSFTAITAGATSVQFNYAMQDAAGIQDPTPATYTLNWSTPLPVVLEFFKASSINCNVVALNWQVRNAMNFNRFVIERSQEGNYYESIATVAYNPVLKAYTYSDEDLKKGQYQYRLKLIDVDGKSQYSPTITQRVDCNQQLTVLYPNPVRDLLSISNTQNGDLISIYSADGKTIKSCVNYQPGTAINVADLAAGTYRLTINRNGKLLESLAFSKL